MLHADHPDHPSMTKLCPLARILIGETSQDWQYSRLRCINRLFTPLRSHKRAGRPGIGVLKRDECTCYQR
jgi:hypothetical protein